MSYDTMNVFAKILRGEIPYKLIYQDDLLLGFKDANPQAPVHVLLIPKEPYMSFMDFCARASAAHVADFFQTVAQIAKNLGIDESGFRLVANTGPESGQEVPHFHVHIIGGKQLGSMV